MIPEYFAVIGAVIASAGGFYYLYETIKGKSQPNRISWLLWGIFPMITFIAQRVQGVEGVSWATFAAGSTPFLVVTASFYNKKAYWRTQPLDYLCAVLGFIGICLWALTKDPNTAILFAIFADTFAGVPTLIKSYKHPQTESWQAFAMGSFGFGLGLLAIQNWDFKNSAFLVYLFVMNTLITILAARKPTKAFHIE